MAKKTSKPRTKSRKRSRKTMSERAGEFVKDEIERIRKGKHGARSAQQAIAIGLSRARRAGVDLPLPKKGQTSDETRRKAAQDSRRGKEHPNAKPNPRRSRATIRALKREGSAAVSHDALSQHARRQARKKTKAERSAMARKAARTRARNAAK